LNFGDCKEYLQRGRVLALWGYQEDSDGFYEWRKEGKHKVPMWVYLKTKEPFAFAGLWDVWRKPDGKRVSRSRSSQRNLTNWFGLFTTVCPLSSLPRSGDHLSHSGPL
jgi:hypothetical protein